MLNSKSPSIPTVVQLQLHSLATSLSIVSLSSSHPFPFFCCFLLSPFLFCLFFLSFCCACTFVSSRRPTLFNDIQLIVYIYNDGFEFDSHPLPCCWVSLETGERHVHRTQKRIYSPCSRSDVIHTVDGGENQQPSIAATVAYHTAIDHHLTDRSDRHSFQPRCCTQLSCIRAVSLQRRIAYFSLPIR